MSEEIKKDSVSPAEEPKDEFETKLDTPSEDTPSEFETALTPEPQKPAEEDAEETRRIRLKSLLLMRKRMTSKKESSYLRPSRALSLRNWRMLTKRKTKRKKLPPKRMTKNPLPLLSKRKKLPLAAM
mgnify:CR=1 FL=1